MLQQQCCRKQIFESAAYSEVRSVSYLDSGDRNNNNSLALHSGVTQSMHQYLLLQKLSTVLFKTIVPRATLSTQWHLPASNTQQLQQIFQKLPDYYCTPQAALLWSLLPFVLSGLKTRHQRRQNIALLFSTLSSSGTIAFEVHIHALTDQGTSVCKCKPFMHESLRCHAASFRRALHTKPLVCKAPAILAHCRHCIQCNYTCKSCTLKIIYKCCMLR